MVATSRRSGVALPLSFGWTRFVSMQNHYNLIYREEEREMMKLCADQGIGVIPWSPLARGRLTRPWSQAKATERANTDEFGKTLYTSAGASIEAADQKIVDAVEKIAKARGVSQAQVALAWMLSKPFVHSPIIGATKPHHLDDAVASLALRLDPEELAQLEQPYVPQAPEGF